MFSERFEGSIQHGAARMRLPFDSQLVRANTLKDDWAFVWDDPLRYNIAYALQSVHLDILLVNHFNIYWAPEAMKFKNAIIQVASVAEAVLQYTLKMVEDDPRVQDVLGKEWVWIDSKEIPLPGVTLPEGQRAVTGLQRMVAKEQLDRNSKMQVLIRAARKTGMVDETMATDLDQLRKLRNRIHIKTLENPECAAYTAKMANDALDLLERYRRVALAWTVQKRQEEATLAATLTQRVSVAAASPDEFEVNDVVEHPYFGPGVVTATEPGIATVVFGDGAPRRFLLSVAGLQKTGVGGADDNTPW